MPKIVVIGAGVSGLTCAMLLSRDKANAITVVAKHMPGDLDAMYASPIAGANFLPMSDRENSQYEARTIPELRRLASDVPRAGIHHQRTRLYRREADMPELCKGSNGFNGMFLEDPWYKDVPELNYTELLVTEEMRAAGIAGGCEFDSVCINTALYLPWLVGECRAAGVVFKRGSAAYARHEGVLGAEGKADIVINATGLGALKLGGVMDQKMVPMRGQVVVVRNVAPVMFGTSGTDDAEDELTYGMTRAAGGGTILGGTYQRGNWDSQPDPATAMRIMQRAIDTVPELLKGTGKTDVTGLDVVRHSVGLRPYREGGVRIEKERMADGSWVVHNYGHSGWGYQGSYGTAEHVLSLIKEITGER
ncbi:FAD dependent oxidoreductase, partial [Microdochium bolleyi]